MMNREVRVNHFDSSDGGRYDDGMIFLVVSLAIMWITFSGYLATKFLVMGAVSIGLALWISRRMGVLHPERVPLYLRLRSLIYWPWLFKEIWLSSVQVAATIWRMPLGITPAMRSVKGAKKGDVGKALYANSITLTPGTLCVDVDGDNMVVHALESQSITELKAGAMDQRVCDFVKDKAGS